jgi:hypothetical protein
VSHFDRGKLVTDWWTEETPYGPVRRRWRRTAEGWDYEDADVEASPSASSSAATAGSTLPGSAHGRPFG